MRPTRTWIVVAAEGRARIVVSDGPGRGLYAAGADTDDLAPCSERLDGDGERLAHALAAAVEAAAVRRRFERLVLVAPPPLLGHLRALLSARTRSLITAEIGRDLTHLTLADLQRHLAATLPI